MRAKILIPVFLLSSAALAEDYWSAAELDDFAASLADVVGENNSAVLDRIIDHGSYFAAIVHREPGPGFSESHDEWADVYFVTSGRGTLVTGGTIPNATQAEPGEIRGTAIDGGESRIIAEGDVVHIPAGMPHHVMVASGDEITYFILKLKAEQH